MTIPQLARTAGVDPTTIRTFIKGKSWPRRTTRQKVALALDWQMCDALRFVARHGYVGLERFTTRELVIELCRRLGHGDESGTSGGETPDIGDFAPAP